MAVDALADVLRVMMLWVGMLRSSDRYMSCAVGMKTTVVNRLVPTLIASRMDVHTLWWGCCAQVQLTVPFSRTAFSSKASFEVRSPKLLNVRTAPLHLACLSSDEQPDK